MLLAVSVVVAAAPGKVDLLVGDDGAATVDRGVAPEISSFEAGKGGVRKLRQVGSQEGVVVWLLKGLLMSCMLAALVEAGDTTCPTWFLTYPCGCFSLLLQHHHVGLMMASFRHAMPSVGRVYSLAAGLWLDA